MRSDGGGDVEMWKETTSATCVWVGLGVHDWERLREYIFMIVEVAWLYFMTGGEYIW